MTKLPLSLVVALARRAARLRAASWLEKGSPFLFCQGLAGDMFPSQISLSGRS